MARFLARRLLQAVIVAAGVLVITFLLVHMLPGGPARAALGAKATATAIAAFNRDNGLDQPLVTQFAVYVGHAMQGNFGFSYVQNESVALLIGQRLPKDLLLIGLAYLVALAVAIPVGVTQAARRNGVADHLVTTLAFLFYSVPAFLLAIGLIDVFSVRLRLLPPGAPQSDSLIAILQSPQGLVLPVVTLALITIAQFSRYVRASGIEALASDYIRTARSKGLSEPSVLARHVVRNSLLPIITLVGLSLPFAVAGAVIIEDIFNYPGMGLLFFTAATNQDYPVLLGVTLVVGLATTTGNLLADIAYGLADPRIRAAA
jgi:peptide/nickel transport system permease protein